MDVTSWMSLTWIRSNFFAVRTSLVAPSGQTELTHDEGSLLAAYFTVFPSCDFK